METRQMDDRRARGQIALERLVPGGVAGLNRSLADIAPEMIDFVIDFGYGDVWSRPELDGASRQVATVAALAALGHAAPQLGFHLTGALNVGLSPRQILEVIYVTTVYAGFPAGINAVAVAREVFDRRGEQPAPAAPPQGERRQRGLDALAESSGEAGRAVLDGLRDIAPELADFILDFSYGDVFCRRGISAAHRETAAIAATTARGSMLPQLKAHVFAGLRVGLSPRQVVEIIMQMAVYAGFPAALNGLGAAREAFAEAGVALPLA